MSSYFIETKATFVEGLEPELPDRRVFSRLKLNSRTNALDKKSLEFYRKNFNLARSASLCGGVYAISRIISLSDSEVLFGSEFSVKSANLSAFLRNCDHVVLMAVSAGGAVVKEVEEAIRLGNGASALIIDAAASEIADAAMDKLNMIVGNALFMKGRSLTKSRFSPGYGDLGLDVQRLFYSILDMKRLGVELTASMQFVPEKTVSAFAGVLRQ